MSWSLNQSICNIGLAVCDLRLKQFCGGVLRFFFFVVTFPRPFIPDVDIFIDEILYFLFVFQEPKKFNDNATQKCLLRCEQGKSVSQIKTDLSSENASDKRRLLPLGGILFEYFWRKEKLLITPIFHDVF